MSNKSAFLYKGRPYNLHDVAKKFKVTKRKLPRLIGNEVVRFSKNRFRAAAWTDTSATKWKKRKDPKKKGRALLVKSGKLRNSIRIISANLDKIVVGSSMPYAAAHNWGFSGSVNVRAHKRDLTAKTKVSDIRSMSIKTRKHRTKTIKVRTGSTTVKAHSRKMNITQRQFLGNSEHLNAKIDRIIFKEIEKIF